MATEAKGVIQAVVPQQRRGDGSTYYLVIVDGVQYIDSKGAFKDSTGKEETFEWEPSQDGKSKFINRPGQRRGFPSKGKSPEEIRDQKKAFALSYAKDQIDVIFSATKHLIKEKQDQPYEHLFEHMRQAMALFTLRTAAKFEAYLIAKEESKPPENKPAPGQAAPVQDDIPF